MHKKKVRARIIWSVIGIVILILGWFSFGPSPSNQSNKTVTVGVVSQTKQGQQIWDQVAKTAKQKYGVTVIVKNFSDYNQPNKALKTGDIDLNAFQHYAFLKAWNKANHGGVVPIGRTTISPIRLYSKKYKSVADLPAGVTIAVPNDATNESRALYVLKNAGLIKLKKDSVLATVADISSNPRNLQIKEVSAEQTGRVIKSVAAAVVNNDFAGPAGLTDKNAIYIEPVNKDSEQWINIIAAKKGNGKKELYQDVVKSYQTKQVAKLLHKFYGRQTIPAWNLKIK
jgi:D-methionine transport system substrate-binding protein